MMITWNPHEHNDQENLKWSMLRAMEWCQWPIFISQPVVPFLLIIIPVYYIAIIIFILNIIWVLFIKKPYINLFVASLGPLIVKIRWIACPLMAFYFYKHNELVNAFVALFWPALIYVLMFLSGIFNNLIPGTPIMSGKFQTLFMAALGYQYHDPNENTGDLSRF